MLWWLWLCLLAPEPPADLAGLLATAPSAADSPARAVWLRRERVVTWHQDGRLDRTLRGTLKVLRGGRPPENVDLGYFGADQRVTVTAARTWHPRRGLVDLQAVSLQRAQLGPFDEVDHLSLQFPTLDAESVLDYEVHLDDQRPTQPEGLSDQWQLGADEPVLDARYAARLPDRTPPNSDPRQFKRPVVVRTVGTDTEYAWQESDVPAGADCPLLVSRLTDWNVVATRYRQAAAGQYRRHAALDAAVARETAGQTDPARALYHYLVTQIAYKVGQVETGAPGITPRPATETFDLRVGDCKDMVTLLITMLARAGITAYPALLRSLSRGILIESLPAMAQFDHVVVAVPQAGGYRWFDPTWRFGPADYLPPKIQGVQALVVTESGARWSVLPIPTGTANFRRRVGDLALSAAGEISGQVEVTAGGAIEQALRLAVANAGPSGVAQELNAQLALQVEPGSVEASAPAAMDKPFTLRYRLARQPYARGNKLLPLRGAVIERAALPRALTDARGPVRLDGAARETEDRLRIRLAPGLAVRELPADQGQKAAWGSWRVTHRLVGDTIEYARTVSLTKPLLAESQVAEALHWYRELVAADNDTFVVLERR